MNAKKESQFLNVRYLIIRLENKKKIHKIFNINFTSELCELIKFLFIKKDKKKNLYLFWIKENKKFYKSFLIFYKKRKKVYAKSQENTYELMIKSY